MNNKVDILTTVSENGVLFSIKETTRKSERIETAFMKPPTPIIPQQCNLASIAFMCVVYLTEKYSYDLGVRSEEYKTPSDSGCSQQLAQ